MRTEAEFFTQLAVGEIHCPCDRLCMARPTRLPEAFAGMPITWQHKTYEEYMTCLTRYVRQEVKDAIDQLRDQRVTEGIPKAVFVLSEDEPEPRQFEKAIKELKIHFAETNGELNKIITNSIFMICEITIHEMRRQ